VGRGRSEVFWLGLAKRKGPVGSADKVMSVIDGVLESVDIIRQTARPSNGFVVAVEGD
jgi:hypothetical protein